MAIYHLSMQIISRSKGQSAVASAAYRSGDRLTDERTGEEKYYLREIEPETMILTPTNSPSWVTDREKLWNEVEKVEKRKDSQLAREMNVALPRELSKDQQKELIRSFIQEQFVNKGMIADIAIHRDDKENPHAHVMLTMRTIDEKGFGKKNRDWNADFANSKENERGFVKSNENCLNIREEWANHANKALEKEGIQERISHLSHEARGLEQLPTVHLGHVAHGMEKRGVESDRGTINRDRQEYNRLVVDLQTYREEKQALEQEKARKQEQRQKAEHFNTPAERVHLKEASKLLNMDRPPTFKELAVKRQELDTWENQLNKDSQHIRSKDETIRKASETYRWIHTFEHQIQQAQQQLETIKWFNPFKLKENRMIKEQAEQQISKAEDQLKVRDETLNTYRKKLGFHTEQEFHQVQSQHQTDYPERLEKNRTTRGQINQERDVLEKARTARQNAFVSQVASLYPERHEMPYMAFSDAQKLNALNTQHGKVIPIESIQKTLDSQKQEIQRLQGELTRVDRNQSRLQRAEGYLKNYEKQHDMIEKIERNPFLKGKILVSKSAKEEYDSAISSRNHYYDLMKNQDVSGKIDLEKQTDISGKMEARTPEIKNQIQSQEKAMGVFEAVIQGLEQAGREMQKEQNQQQKQKVRNKNKTRNRQNVWELDR